MSISKKIIEGNNQPSEGNAVVGGGVYRSDVGTFKVFENI